MARQERDRANDAAVTAEQKARTAERISEFLVGLFEASDPNEAKGKSISAHELLDIGAARIRALDEEPEIKVELQETIGWVFLVLGRINDARPLLDGALKYREANAAGNEAELAQCLHMVANLHDLAGDYKLAEPLAEKSLKLREQLFGDSRAVAQSLNTLGNVLWHQDRLEEASVLHRRALKIRERLLPADHEDIAQSLHNLGALRYFANDLAEAERMYKRAIEIESASDSEGNHALATSMHVLAIVYQDQGKYAEAIELEEQSIAVKKEVLGEAHPYVALGLTTLGNIHRLSDRPELAEPEIRRAIEIAEAAWGREYGEVWWMRRSLAEALRALDRTEDAIAELEDLIGTIEGADRLGSLPSNLNLLADIHREAGRLNQAETLYRRSMEIDSTELERGEAGAMKTLIGLARTLYRLERLEEAEISFRKALSAMKREWGEEDREVLEAQNDFAELLLERGKGAEARELAETVRAAYRKGAEAPLARPHELIDAARACVRTPIKELRDPNSAVEFARRAVDTTERRHPVYLAVLAEALNAAGDAPAAVGVQTEALNLLKADSPRRARFEEVLRRYTQGENASGD